MYLLKCEDTYLILQNKYLHIYEDSFGAKILIDRWLDPKPIGMIIDFTKFIILKMSAYFFSNKTKTINHCQRLINMHFALNFCKVYSL